MGCTFDDKVYIMGDIQHATRKRENMTNNNNKKPINCACGQLSCASFVAGNQCFRCEQVDNRHAGITFADEHAEHVAWFRQVDKRTAEHKAGPNYIDPIRYA